MTKHLIVVAVVRGGIPPMNTCRKRSYRWLPVS